MTILAKLLAEEEDTMNYITYVFECLDDEIKKQTKYLMCVRWPNWDHRTIELGEIGYLNFEEIRAGITMWYDGDKMIPYKYNNIQFIKFVSKKEKFEYKM